MSTDVALHTAPKWPRAVNLEALGCRDSGAGDTLNNADRIVGDLGGVHTRGGGGEGSGVSKTKNERAANVMGGDRSASYKKKPMHLYICRFKNFSLKCILNVIAAIK